MEVCEYFKLETILLSGPLIKIEKKYKTRKSSSYHE